MSTDYGKRIVTEVSAFLARNGPAICYPGAHQHLMERILENGAVISEYPPNTPPDKLYFPKRNRLISAWSHKVLVVEAGLNSGSLITAESAEKNGPEVLSVPDNIFSRESMGSNALIQKGAKIYLGESQRLPQNASI